MAALIDGRLGSRRALRVLLQLAASRDKREIFADAVAIVRELGSAEPGPEPQT